MLISKISILYKSFIFNSERFFFIFNTSDIEFSFLIIFLLVSFLLANLLLLISYLISQKSLVDEKRVDYECGFESFSSSRGLYDASFCLVAILSILFDLEIIVLYPWVLSLTITHNFGFFVGLFFLLILLLGFCYEWVSGIFDFLSTNLAVNNINYF